MKKRYQCNTIKYSWDQLNMQKTYERTICIKIVLKLNILNDRGGFAYHFFAYIYWRKHIFYVFHRNRCDWVMSCRKKKHQQQNTFDIVK